MKIHCSAVAPVSKSGHLAAASLDTLLSHSFPSLFVSFFPCSHSSISSVQLRCSQTVLHHLFPVFHHTGHSTNKVERKTCHMPRSGDPVSPSEFGSSLISLSSEGSTDASALTSLLNSAPSTWRHGALQQRPPTGVRYARGYCGRTTPLPLSHSPARIASCCKFIAESLDLCSVKGRCPLVTDSVM